MDIYALYIAIGLFTGILSGIFGIYHKMILEGEEVNLTQGFDNLYIESYKQILAQGGFGLDDAMASIKLAYELRNLPVSEPNEDSHTLCCKNKTDQ